MGTVTGYLYLQHICIYSFTYACAYLFLNNWRFFKFLRKKIPALLEWTRRCCIQSSAWLCPCSPAQGRAPWTQHSQDESPDRVPHPCLTKAFGCKIAFCLPWKRMGDSTTSMKIRDTAWSHLWKKSLVELCVPYGKRQWNWEPRNVETIVKWTS